MIRLYLIGAALALGAGAVLWVRHDAAQDVRDRIERDALKGRIETIEDAKRRRNDVDAMPDDDLERSLLDRLRGADATD